jgi:hypothetical protein
LRDIRDFDYGYDDGDYGDNDDDKYSSEDDINLSYVNDHPSSVIIIADSNAKRRVNRNTATLQNPPGNA